MVTTEKTEVILEMQKALDDKKTAFWLLFLIFIISFALNVILFVVTSTQNDKIDRLEILKGQKEFYDSINKK